MLKEITLENVKDLPYSNEDYTMLGTDKLMATEDLGGGHLASVVLPTMLPIDGDGDVFIPGDFGENYLHPGHALYAELGVDCQSANISFQTGAVLPHEGNELFRFELKAPTDATHVLICVDWSQGTPPVATQDTVSEELGAEFMHRREATANAYGMDLWIMPKPTCLAQQLSQVQYAINLAISDGDAYAATAPLVAQTYLQYMESLLPSLSSEKERYTLKSVDSLHVNLVSWRLGVEQPATELVAELTCDLKGVQQLMRIIATKRK